MGKRAAVATVLSLLLAALPAQDDEYGLGLGNLADLFNLLVSPQPPASLPPSPAPAPSPSPQKPIRVCPVCGTSFPGSATAAGVIWGYRLDLRAFGQGVTDPPPLPLCPNCRFVLYADAYTELELARLRSFVAAEAYKGISSDNFPYFYMARILEEKVIPLKYGSYSVALAYLRASWQAEDYGDDRLTRSYLEKALQWMDAYAKEVKSEDYYFATSRILPGEILRRLGRFAEAEARFAPLESDTSFQAAYLKRIVAAERALIKAKESSPQASP